MTIHETQLVQDRVISATGKRYDITYPEPATLEEAQQRFDALTIERQQIQAQLGERSVERDGLRLSSEEYWTWRSKAVWALTFKEREQRYLKGWIKRENERLAKERLIEDRERKDTLRTSVEDASPFIDAYLLIGDILRGNDVRLTDEQHDQYRRLRRVFKAVRP